ncbi:retrotransposon hot spot (RHS) protein, putative [Trypanosoma cruzi]|nr:retrotransposon hot spot (RHS) protein, putative [Trypanosoma cruzi]
MSSMTMSAPIRPEGCYESVYNARWHHVVEVPDGEGTGLEVREGEPPHSWTYKAVGDTLEKDDGVEQSGEALLRLMVLTSEKAWPYSWKWKENKSTRDCYVKWEVVRVWQIVKKDLTEWFSPDAGEYFTPKRRVLIGTPGIGKSMAAGSYLLYQLLHCDVEKLPMVVCFVGGSMMHVSEKTTQTVREYMGTTKSKRVFFLAAVRLCGSVLAVRLSSFAVAPLLCWWGRERAAASVELRSSGRGKAPTAADGDGLCCRRSDGMTSPVSQLTEMDEGRTASLSPLFVPSVHCSHTHRAASARLTSGCLWANRNVQSVWTLFPCLIAAVLLCSLLCAMPTRVNEKRRIDCWRPASSPLFLRTTNKNTFCTRLMAGGRNAATWPASAPV